MESARQRFVRVCLLLLVLSGIAMEAGAQVAYDGVLFVRGNRWDSYPSHLFINGKHYIWWCGQSSVGGYWGQWVDAIFYTTKNSTLGSGGWSSPWQVFNNTNSPWAINHVCDPTVIPGSFSYGGSNYSFALYYTADNSTTTPGVDNAVGLAFSNNGTSWTAYPSIVISTQGTPNGTYGAGASGAAINPVTSQIVQLYDDTTMTPPTRLKGSMNGISFAPTPPSATQLNVAGRGGSAAPDVSFHNADRHWYVAIQTYDAQGVWGGETRVLRSVNPEDLYGSWELVGTFNRTVTGNTSNNNPGLGRQADTTLYVDAQGWAYTFFGTGSDTDPWGWDLAQGRFRPGGSPSSVLVKVDPSEPGFLAVTGDATAAYLPVSAVVSIPGGTTANTDHLWNAQATINGKTGFNGFVDAATEGSPLVTISVAGIRIGTAYDVYGRFGTAPLQTPPNIYGIEMGLSPTAMSRYDQTTSNFTLVTNWSNWQEREVYLGIATAGSDGKIHLYIDENTVSQTAIWTGMRLVKR